MSTWPSTQQNRLSLCQVVCGPFCNESYCSWCQLLHTYAWSDPFLFSKGCDNRHRRRQRPSDNNHLNGSSWSCGGSQTPKNACYFTSPFVLNTRVWQTLSMTHWLHKAKLHSKLWKADVRHCHIDQFKSCIVYRCLRLLSSDALWWLCYNTGYINLPLLALELWNQK